MKNAHSVTRSPAPRLLHSAVCALLVLGCVTEARAQAASSKSQAQPKVVARNQLMHVTNLPQPTAPTAPFRLPKEGSGLSDPEVSKYAEQIDRFLQQRLDYAQSLKNKSSTWFSLSGNTKFSLITTKSYVPEKLVKWNKNIFWPPASISNEVNLRFADEVRSVLGPIPEFDVTVVGKRALSDGSTIETGLLLAEVDGNQVELLPNPNKPGTPLEFRHRAADGTIVKWTTTVDQCDKPSLAGGVTPCGTASRISRITRGNVEWIALARKTKGVEALKSEVFWSADNPEYTLVGYIGFNRQTGEVAFFDGAYDGRQFSWKTTIVAPGGKGYQDEKGRALALTAYDASFRVNCAACHDNKEPRIATPYIKQARVGYRSPTIANAFSLGELLPDLPRKDSRPYRVVGTDYNTVHAAQIRDARTVRDPSGKCTECHSLTNYGTARFASDSVGRLGSLTGDAAPENAFRTSWALRTGAGAIHPWMNPGDGNDLSATPLAAPLSDSDWAALKVILEKPAASAQSTVLFTDPPAPGEVQSPKTKLADLSVPTGLSVRVSKNRDGDNPDLPNELEISWLYLNSLGGVPERDDVRFNIALREVDLLPNATPPKPGDFPTIDIAKGIGATQVAGPVSISGQSIIVLDVSYSGHIVGTDPMPTVTPRQYSVQIPASAKKRYLIRLLPKRYTFDGVEDRFGIGEFVAFIDVP